MINLNELQFKSWQTKLQDSPNFRKFWVFWSNYSTTLFVPGFIFLLYQDDWVLLFAFGIVAFALVRGVLSPVLSKHFPQQRPYQQFGFEPITSRFLSWQTQAPNSFPSRHVMAMAATAGVTLLFYWPVGIYFVLLSVATGAGRVVLGYHFPKDIYYALVLGISASITFVLVTRVLLFTTAR